MGKTETIKERAIYVYLPAHDMVEQWKRLVPSLCASGTYLSARVDFSLMCV